MRPPYRAIPVARVASLAKAPQSRDLAADNFQFDEK
jgi:hypothetical protein